MAKMNWKQKAWRAAALAVLLGIVPGPAATAGGTAGPASFVDPTAELPQSGSVELSDRVYVAPFARLSAKDGHVIRIGDRANVQDNALLDAAEHDIVLGDRAIVAHGAQVRSTRPAMIAAQTQRPEYSNPGIQALESYMTAHPGELLWGAVPAFIGFNAAVDGAVISDGSMVMHMAKVSPGVTLRSGVKVKEGKWLRTQEEADNPTLGKVEYIGTGDIEFMTDVVEVNTQLAAGYAQLAWEHASFVRGINYNPGRIPGNEQRTLPAVGGVRTQQPDTGPYRFRIIGNVQIADLAGVRDGVSLRADEGPLIRIGAHGRFLGGNTFHALKSTRIYAGRGVVLEPGALVHGGRGPHLKGETWTEIGDETVIGAGAVVFRSKLGKGVRVGARSLVMDSVLPDGTVVPEGEIWIEGRRKYSAE
ncbi:hypothetical protein [Paenibacillus mucilaginosus]|uniref:Uncharacterized protein n=1 Tax=Paenibacillus mucilaginosus (strain KNP414) TaxID=1036673 RepID=F8F6R6_PAEMK|nr:hypothetical protein [Paenibacillus mucilaginosus]AEI43582.1 hypothetical protein KNP414_05058 [Paenibacillus mucilaginosus KNP414]MCG7211883.1 hypothetical protein [Paenibacillus mucilaginosus]WDM25116.1 hypothetical protein KCX80_21905 [Paenibacillus mucilaginosus]